MGEVSGRTRFAPTEERETRKCIRLREYDYSRNGAYFVTICVKDMKCLLGRIVVGANRVRPELTDVGEIVDYEIRKIEEVYENVAIDKYIVMPNHVHMIIIIIGNICGRTRFAPTSDGADKPTISQIVKQTKGVITKRIGYPIWQRSFHDRVIRNYEEYKLIYQYIDENPITWEKDRYYG